MKSYFPDVNVWLALVYRGHVHHPPAAEWFSRLDHEKLHFCRFTQVAFLRLLTHASVMREDVRHQHAAWQTYNELLSDDRVSFLTEPDAEELEKTFRTLTSSRQATPQQWADAYLAAFAHAAGLTLVTFDRALRELAPGGALLLA